MLTESGRIGRNATVLEAPPRPINAADPGGRYALPDSHPTKRRSPDGSKLFPTQKEWDRFWLNVGKQDNGCWLWTGCKSGWRRGYGKFCFRNRNQLAHRFIYRAWPTTEPIPEATPQLDHRCRNTSCVNPAHLDPVTNRENSLRGIGFSAINVRKTHCPHGHPYTPENTMRDRQPPGGPRRKCRACSYARNASSRAQRARLR